MLNRWNFLKTGFYEGIKNWANTLDIYDYLQVLVSLEVFLDNCSDIAKKLSPETP